MSITIADSPADTRVIAQPYTPWSCPVYFWWSADGRLPARRPYQRERGEHPERAFEDGRPASMIDPYGRARWERAEERAFVVPKSCQTRGCIGTIAPEPYSTGMVPQCGSCKRRYG